MNPAPDPTAAPNSAAAPIEKISDADLLKMSDAELRQHGFTRDAAGRICHLPTNYLIQSVPPPPPQSARERLAAAAAEMRALRNAAAAEFRAELDRLCKLRGFALVAEPRIRSVKGLFTLDAELVIVDRSAEDDRDRADAEGDEI